MAKRKIKKKSVSRKNKLHWTQTPEGKKKLSRIMKKGWITRKANLQIDNTLKAQEKVNDFFKAQGASLTPETTEKAFEVGEDIAYENRNTQQYHEAIAYTHVTTWLNLYAEFQGISESSLTRELAEALLRKVNG